MEVRVVKPTAEQISEASGWPIWEKEPSTFDWEYSEPEVFYVIEGKARVKTPAGEVAFGAGDMVFMPKGLKCTWVVEKRIRKNYRFG